MDQNDKKIKDLELQVKNLNDFVRRLSARIDYLEKERTRLRTNIDQLSYAVRKK